ETLVGVTPDYGRRLIIALDRQLPSVLDRYRGYLLAGLRLGLGVRALPTLRRHARSTGRRRRAAVIEAYERLGYRPKCFVATQADLDLVESALVDADESTRARAVQAAAGLVWVDPSWFVETMERISRPSSELVAS